jgi:hypothetical protein
MRGPGPGVRRTSLGGSEGVRRRESVSGIGMGRRRESVGGVLRPPRPSLVHTRRSVVMGSIGTGLGSLAAILAAKEHEETAVMQAAFYRRRSSLGGGGGRSRSATWSSGLDASLGSSHTHMGCYSDSGTPLPPGFGHTHAALTPAREEDELEAGQPSPSPGRLTRGSRRASM